MKTIVLFLFAGLFMFIPQLSSQEWVKVEAGAEFSVALKSDGTIWAWGFNGNGQLGAGENTEMEPIQVGTDSDWADIFVGALSTFALKEDGSLWGWGFNFYGNLGLGHMQTSVRSPQQVGNDTSWLDLSVGVAHTLGLKKDSSLWSFGWNEYGQLGHSAGTDVNVPTQVDSHKYIDIAAGRLHNMAIRSDRTLWGWGSNEVMQVGSKFDTSVVWVPTMIDSSKEWMNVECGFQYSAAQKLDSTLYTWGFNGNGQLGHGNAGNIIGVPTIVDSMKQWRQVSAGASFMHAILDDGSLWGWGFNGLGQLGNGSNSQRSSPVQIGQDTSWEIVSDASGFIDPQSQSVLGLHSLALKLDRSFICATGANYVGQLGNGGSTATVRYDCSIADISTSLFQPNEFEAVLNVYPVPASNQLFVEYVNAESDWTLELYDTHSKLQMRRELNRLETYKGDITSLPPGIYYLVVKENGTVIGREKIVIAH
jgi:alpha-tubulin suppressor-like RCC1 family protein